MESGTCLGFRPWLESHGIAILAAARAASGVRSPTRKQSNCLSCLSTQRQVPPSLAPLSPQLPPPNSDGRSLTFALCVSQAKDECHFWPRGATRGGLWEPTRPRPQAGKAAACWLLITAALLARICAAFFCGFIVLYFRGWLRCGF